MGKVLVQVQVQVQVTELDLVEPHPSVLHHHSLGVLILLPVCRGDFPIVVLIRYLVWLEAPMTG